MEDAKREIADRDALVRKLAALVDGVEEHLCPDGRKGKEERPLTKEKAAELSRNEDLLGPLTFTMEELVTNEERTQNEKRKFEESKR